MSKEISVIYNEDVDVLSDYSQVFDKNGEIISWRIKKQLFKGKEDGDVVVSDGFHTMEELYEHRIRLFIVLCRALSSLDTFVGIKRVWRSKLHSDGGRREGWFLLGIGETEGEQITYHLPVEKWDETDFAETLDRAPLWDGHTPADVLKRLMDLI